ncbi:MAG: CRTAC1 family protein [Planctomycetota bacterium]|nr:CRTAC1 family protein [Planctomycetota bacterium]
MEKKVVYSIRLSRLMSVIALLVLASSLLGSGCRKGVAPQAEVEASDQAGQLQVVDPGDPWFEPIETQAGLVFHHVNGHDVKYYMPEITAGGAGWFDLEGDGDLDVYFVQSGVIGQELALNPPNQLFRNEGDGVFTDITDSSGAGDQGYGMGLATGDYDGDGDVDLYVTNYGPNTMLRNNGDGTFTDVTEVTGTGNADWGASAVFLDYDADGDLDLYCTNYIYWSPKVERTCGHSSSNYDYCAPVIYQAPTADILYRNDGDGTFTDVSKESGIQSELGTGLGVVCLDFNGDGYVDIYVANDGMRNVLWVNQGDGTFLNEALLAGCAVDQDGRAKAGMGVSVADVDEDGNPDLLVVNLNKESDSFYRNQGEYFIEEAALVGLSTVSRMFTRFGVGFADFDNDGRLDIYQANGKVTKQEGPFVPGGDPYAEPNILVKGTETGRFEEVSPRGGVAEDLIHVSRAAAFADFDNDGGMDILVANLNGTPYLLRNVAPDRGGWIGFDVREMAGGPALGAKVSFQIGERTIVREIRTGSSYMAASDPRIHVGLGGTNDGPSSITVRWSDGTTQQFTDEFTPGQYHTLKRES